MKFTKVVKAENLSFNESYEQRYNRFVDELEKLTLKYGIVLNAVGAVYDLEGESFNGYIKDPSSGDLIER